MRITLGTSKPLLSELIWEVCLPARWGCAALCSHLTQVDDSPAVGCVPLGSPELIALLWCPVLGFLGFPMLALGFALLFPLAGPPCLPRCIGCVKSLACHNVLLSLYLPSLQCPELRGIFDAVCKVYFRGVFPVSPMLGKLAWFPSAI